MNSILDLFMGDPVYDEQKNVIRRDFGVKNIVAIMVVGFAGYSLMGEMKPISGKRKTKPISGKRKMKGGGEDLPAAADDAPSFFPILVGGVILGCGFYFAASAVGSGFQSWTVFLACVVLGIFLISRKTVNDPE